MQNILIVLLCLVQIDSIYTEKNGILKITIICSNVGPNL